ncbi:branched-chain amino acid transport system permease protein [Modicisalibacter muralis]|uniref:Branched-chain amino acid transport system permease protein n=1 Tax=Modicisalibacter muralis TaxID=119000 RepID=A0A1G9GVE2_9GAMM|nr:branched-chain amino acid ABC transporter permease [Halomonas muralis]SDL04680.1 branched-chain amino acid transport system permease protein [Halomonas muralis]
MAKHRAELLVNLVIALALPAAALTAWALGESFYVSLVSRVAILALAGVGLNLALGYGGMVSFGHAAFFGLGAYAAGIFAFHAFDGTPVISWPIQIMGAASMPVGWLAAIVVAGLAALAIGAISLRTSGVYFIMITLAFAQMLYYLAVSIPTYGGADGLILYLRSGFPGLDSSDDLTFFALCYALLMLAIFITWRIAGSRFGMALRGASRNEERLAAVGISPYPIKLVAFCISAMITAVAGALFAELVGFVSPTLMAWKMSGEILIFVILGGVGRLYAPIIGAAIFILLETLIGGITDRWQFVLGLVLLGVVLFARGGVMGALTGRARHV